MRASVLGFLSILQVPPATAQTPIPTPTPTPTTAPIPAAPAESSTITVSAGTRVQAALQRQFTTWSKDSIYLVTTYPASLNGVIAIPAGTFVQAGFDRVTGKDTGGTGHGPVLAILVAYLIYPNGYVVRVSSRSSVVATSQLGIDKVAHGVVVPLIGMAVSPLLGSAIGGANGGIRGAGRGLLIGSGIAAVSGIVALSLAHSWVLEAGLPVEVEFQDSLTVDRARATAPGAVSNLGLIPQAPRRKAITGNCFSPGTPGTPDIVIPGTPGTPPVGDFPGTPATPPTIIPGTPGTQGYWHSC